MIRSTWRRSVILSITIQLLLASVSDAQAVPRYHALDAADAHSDSLFASVSVVRPHADGSLLLLDLRAQRVVWLSASLDSLRTVADRAGKSGLRYLSRVAGLIPWPGDSTLFVDPATYSMPLLDRRGIVGRVLAMPPIGGSCFIGGPSGAPALDADGRVVCRAPRLVTPGVRAPEAIVGLPILADSAALIRVDLKRHVVDTVTFLNVGRLQMSLFMNGDCVAFVLPRLNPLPVVDDWTVSGDGDITVIRGAPYAIQRFGRSARPSGRLPIPHTIRRMSDDEKIAYLDSTRSALEELRGRFGPVSAASSKPAEAAGCDARNPAQLQIIQPQIADDPVRIASLGGRSPAPLLFISAGELPDEIPHFAPGSTHVDGAGNLWVRTLEAVEGGSIYDIIDRANSLSDRVLVPPGRIIVGFGRNGAVFMAVSEKGGVRLERTHYRKR